MIEFRVGDTVRIDESNFNVIRGECVDCALNCLDLEFCEVVNCTKGNWILQREIKYPTLKDERTLYLLQDHGTYYLVFPTFINGKFNNWQNSSTSEKLNQYPNNKFIKVTDINFEINP